LTTSTIPPWDIRAELPVRHHKKWLELDGFDDEFDTHVRIRPQPNRLLDRLVSEPLDPQPVPASGHAGYGEAAGRIGQPLQCLLVTGGDQSYGCGLDRVACASLSHDSEHGDHWLARRLTLLTCGRERDRGKACGHYNHPQHSR
jgi:hypothetical protein